MATKIEWTEMQQLTLDLMFQPEPVLVVPNCWNKEYHLQHPGGLTAFYDDPGKPDIFHTIEAAVEFSRSRGVEPVVPDRTKWAWD
jgi:hypothetical protein